MRVSGLRFDLSCALLAALALSPGLALAQAGPNGGFALNRFDIAIPLAEQRLQLALQTLRADDERVVDARFELARAYTATSVPDRVVEQLEPLLPSLRERGKAGWDELSSALYMVAIAYSHLGRFEDSQRIERQAGIGRGHVSFPYGRFR